MSESRDPRRAERERAVAFGPCPFATQRALLEHVMAVVGDPGPVVESAGPLSLSIGEAGALLVWTETRAYFSVVIDDDLWVYSLGRNPIGESGGAGLNGVNCGAAPEAGRARRERLAAAAAGYFAAARAETEVTRQQAREVRGWDIAEPGTDASVPAMVSAGRSGEPSIVVIDDPNRETGEGDAAKVAERVAAVFPAEKRANIVAGYHEAIRLLEAEREPEKGATA